MLCLDRSVVSFTLCLPATYSADLRRPVPTDRAAMDGQACCKLHLLHLGLPHNPHQYQHLFRISLLIYHRPYNHHLISLLHHNHFLNTTTACYGSFWVYCCCSLCTVTISFLSRFAVCASTALGCTPEVDCYLYFIFTSSTHYVFLFFFPFCCFSTVWYLYFECT